MKKLFGGGTVDMTEGSIFNHLVRFSLPLLLGNLFQQFYNTVDTWVVGNYVSNEAFSAVGSVGPIVNMLVGFFSGLASGAGVVISQNFGAKNYDKVGKAVHTSIVMTLVMSVLFTALGILMIPMMLGFMKTPEEVLPDSTAYLTIYFAGITGLMVYNMGAGILRAVGDSRKPFIYLVVSALTNIVLDLVFVLWFRMGVEGVAYATIISQGLSAILVTVNLFTTDTCVRITLREMKADFRILWQIIRIGIPASIQMAITGFSNIFVQSYINFFGADFMAGWTAYGKIDQFVMLPIQSIALASTTFVGQNLGIDNEERALKGVRTALLMSLGATVILMIPVLLFAPQITAFFNPKETVVEYGSLILWWITPFCLLPCINQITAGAMRGAGNSQIPMIIMLFSFVAFRQIYLFVMTNYISNSIVPVIMGYPAGWFVASVLSLLYYKKFKLKRVGSL